MSYLFVKTYEFSSYVLQRTDTTIVVIAVCALQQGIQELPHLATQYLFKDEFGLSPASMGALVSIIYLPW
jgi:hypothetical protein